ncbi:MAG: 2'-5' RNA ligase family protein [Ferruginibacter sp.]
MKRTGKPPLILTLNIDEVAHSFFAAQRRLYFPPHINYLDAHLTLFHNLPSDDTLIAEALNVFANREPFELRMSGVRHIGKGVVYTLISDELQQLHTTMQKTFSTMISGKDTQKLWPHITVQNKVTANKADLLYKKLLKEYEPFPVTATGFSTWLYLKGPWEKVTEYSFGPDHFTS